MPRMTTTIAVALVLTLPLMVLTKHVPAQDEISEMTPQRSFYAANGLLNRGHYELAVDEYRNFLRSNPDKEQSQIARYGLGVSLFRLNRLDEARTELALLQSIDDFTYRTEVLIILGQCHLMLRDLDAAVDTLSNVVTEFSNHELTDDAVALLTEALYLRGDHAEASAAGSFLVDQWPGSPLRERAELFAAMSEIALRDYPRATDRLQSMAKRFPAGEFTDHTSLLLAQSLQQSNFLNEAVAQYRKVIKQSEDKFVPGALYGLAGILHQQGEHESAGELLDDLLKRFPDNELDISAQLLRGRIWFALHDFDRAREYFSDIADAEDDHQEEALYWVAKCDLRNGDHTDAITGLRNILREFPETDRTAEIMFDLAVALSREGETDEALEELRNFLEEFPDHLLTPDALQLAASLEHAQERYEESRTLCREFQTNYSDHTLAPSMAFLSAENSYLMGEYERTVSEFVSFLEEYSDSDERSNATYRLGMALYRLQQYEEAEPFLSLVVDGNNTPEEFRSALLALGDLYFQLEQWEQSEPPLVNFLAFGLEQEGADDALLRLALSRHRQEKYESALTAYELLIDEFPESVHKSQAVFERGQVLVALNRNSEAAEAFDQILDDADDPLLTLHALNHLGVMAMNDQRFDEAAEFFGQVVNEGEGEQIAPALYKQGQAQMAAKNYKDAEPAFARLLADYPESEYYSEAHAQRALALARLDRHEDALDQISTTIEQFSTDLAASLISSLIYEKAWCLRSLGEHELAADAYRELIEMQEKDELHLHSLLELAELESDNQRYDEAAQLLRELLDDEHRSVITEMLHQQGTYRLGVCEYELSHFNESTNWLDTFIDTYPKHNLITSARLLCGEAYFKSGAHQRAVEHLRAVVDDGPADDDIYGPALLRLGECLAALQHWVPSEEAFKTYLNEVPDSELWFQAQFGVAWALENQKRFDAAITEYRKVVDRHNGPTAARSQFQIGECLYAQNKYEDAARELLKVDILYAYPEWSAAALYEAGRCFEGLNQPTEAAEQFRQLQEQYSDSQWAVLAAERLGRLSSAALPGRTDP